jgi:DnaJ-domain-containing protein 1
MSWAGKFIGGALGAVFGGPFGAAARAAPGHPGDEDEAAADEPTGELEQLAFSPVVVSAGPALRLDFTFSAETAVPEGTVVFVQLLDAAGEFVKGTGDWADEHGDFCAVAELQHAEEDDEAATAEVAVPLLAPQTPERVRTVRATALAGETLVAGPTEWSCDHFRRRNRWEDSRLGAATAAAVAMCRAGGGPSAVERAAVVEALVEGFELDELGEEAARATLAVLVKKPSNYDTWFSDDVEFATAIAEFLTTIARADGELEPHEARFIASFRERFGVPDDEEPVGEDEDETGAADEDDEPEAPAASRAQDPLAVHYAALDLQPGVSLLEVKAAYRRLAAEYHPDRTSTMAPRFQVFATREMQRLNAAWEALSRALKP